MSTAKRTGPLVLTDEATFRQHRRSQAESVLDDLTVLILTYNEEPNIGRTLDRLQWAPRVLVIDSLSTDATAGIIRRYPQAVLRTRGFDNHSNQWNYGLSQVKTEWVLSLDADYQVGESFVSELRGLRPDERINAYYARFQYCVAGRSLRATLYPPRAVLFRRSACHYQQDGHTQMLHIEGETGWLRSPICHDDRKPFSDWLKSQHRYALLEARHLQRNSWKDLNVQDRLRKLVLPAPLLVFFYTLLFQGLVLDGWRGWFYVFQRTLAEALLSLRLLDAKLR